MEKKMSEISIKHKFVVVEGPIGVGKSTLALRLSRKLGYRFLADTDAANPYLEKFYRNPRQYALHTQLHFMLSRIDALTSGVGADERHLSLADDGLVSDFFLDKDGLFAAETLDEQEFALYQRLLQRMGGALPYPDLVIYLQAPVEILIERIEKRGHKFEQRMDSSYLRRIVDRYESYFHQYDQSPLLVVNASEINLADNRQDFANLLQNIAEITAGRHYLNPIAEVS